MRKSSNRSHILRRFFFSSLLLLVLFGIGNSLSFVNLAQSAAIITATKTDVLLTDADSSSSLTPGDTVRYTTVINNSGSDPATAVSFSDTIDSGTTLSGSAHVSPVAFNDSYDSLGNVGITVLSAANGVLANDIDPDSTVSLSVVASAGATTQGGAFAMAANGTFSYSPPAGFEGVDTFTYTLTDGDTLTPNDTATVNITVNEVIWFVNSSSPTQGTGVLINPFNSLDGVSGYNNAASDETADTIFIYSGSYSGGIALLNNQKLIGQGATATIAAITGITVPPHSNALPSTSGARPSISNSSGNGVILAQNNLLRGLNVSNTSARAITDNGGSVGSLTISQVAITGTGSGFEADNGGTLAVSLDSLNANSGNHGLSLANTTGNFSVTGTGAANSGGTLSGHTAEGVLLNNVTNVSLTDMVINQSATASTQGIDATSVTGFSLTRLNITAGSASSYALLGSSLRNLTAVNTTFDGGGGSVANIDGVRITNLLGTSSFSNSTFRNGKDINLLIENSVNGGGLDTLTISGTAFSNSAGGDHLQVQSGGTANLKLVVNGNSSFSGTGQDGMQLEAEGNATLQADISAATFNNTLGSTVNMGATSNGRLIANVHNLSNLTSSGTNVINMISFDTSRIDATVANNTITSATAGNGIRVIQEGNGNIYATISGNTISGVTQGSGILVQGRAGTSGNGRIDATINGNSVTTTTALSLDGIEVTSGSSAGGDTNTVCLNMLNNTSSSAAYDGYFLRHRAGSTFYLQNFAGPADSSGITNWVNTTKSNIGSVFVSDAAGFANAPANCGTPTAVSAITAPTAVAAADRAPAITRHMTPRQQMSGWAGQPATAVSGSEAAAKQTSLAKPLLAGETVTVNIGTLPAGKSVTIVFDVVVNNDAGAQICNQATVSGNGFSNVLSDDPDVGGSSDPTCSAVTLVNKAPVANDDSYSGVENTTLNVAAPGVLDNDTDGDGDTLTAVLDTNPSHGNLTLNSDGSFSYEPDALYCGSDSFTYHANDGTADANTATVTLAISCVDYLPIVAVDVSAQSAQYSDSIDTVTVTATDVDSHPLTISDNAPANLSTSGSCAPSGIGTSCAWQLSGQVQVNAATYGIDFTVSDATTDVVESSQLVVTPEDAAVWFDGSNPVAVPVASSGGSSEPFSLLAYVQENSEGGASAAPGDINLADVALTLQPIGPGSPVTVTCTSAGAVTPYDYSAVLRLSCDFSSVPVNAYVATAVVDGGYYSGSAEETLVVYDASLGFTTGGGWFYWPGTTDRTTFGYTMQYNKKGTKVQGNLVMIRHMDGQDAVYRIKSNSLYGLSLGEGSDGGATYGWAIFSGKATYQAPGMSDPEGNYDFTIYVEDRNEPGTGVDHVWVQVRDKDGAIVADMSMDAAAQDNAVPIMGGNIVVPHKAADGGGGGGGRGRGR